MFLFGSDLALAATTLRALADDLDKIAAGEAPTAAQLALAPVISRWRPELNRHRRAALSGIVSGDPLYGHGERIWLELLAADPDLGWVRGLLSWYRLGPAEAELQACGHA